VEVEFEDIVAAAAAARRVTINPWRAIFRRRFLPQLVVLVALQVFNQMDGINVRWPVWWRAVVQNGMHTVVLTLLVLCTPPPPNPPPHTPQGVHVLHAPALQRHGLHPGARAAHARHHWGGKRGHHLCRGFYCRLTWPVRASASPVPAWRSRASTAAPTTAPSPALLTTCHPRLPAPMTQDLLDD
jgi:hypothetical protein